MAKNKGQVKEQSLEVLKKSVKAGGRKSAARTAEKKPATPVRSASRSRSRSRSRTPGRTQKAAEPPKKAPTPAKTAPKKTPARKKSEPAKLKRLDTEKKSTRGGKGKKAAAPKGKAKGKAAAGPKSKGKKAETSIEKAQPMETNNIATSTTSLSASSKGRKSTSPVGSSESVNGSSGWFSKCIIS